MAMGHARILQTDARGTTKIIPDASKTAILSHMIKRHLHDPSGRKTQQRKQYQRTSASRCLSNIKLTYKLTYISLLLRCKYALWDVIVIIFVIKTSSWAKPI